ncbi:MAG: hypothetical protein BGO68_00010 [Candidatus Amoebophilus sp. 36-38]|nr:MAG: hypothetical protein BGO68_00010 [Candidatus Amoebophilus sp. 36-38]
MINLYQNGTQSKAAKKFLTFKGDPSGKSIACQITRKRAYLDLLADYVAEELDKKEEPNLTLPIVRMLGHLKFGASISMGVDQTCFHRNIRRWLPQENPLIKQDEQFWKVIEQSISSISGNEKIYKNRALRGLYSEIEKANKEFIIRSASMTDAEDGLGSDSEYEEEISEEEVSEEQLYAKKITVTTGMMAINVAHYLARYYLKKCLNEEEYRTECKSMYYETKGALKLAKKNSDELAVLNNKRKKNIPTVLFFDLNHCDTSGSGHTRLKYCIEESLFEKEIPIVVIDYTSSTPSYIKCAISDAVDSGIKLILLVNSGLKNEQCAADNNPYGTVRIITLDKEERDVLYNTAKRILEADGGLPATAHKIRKSYKRAGFTLSNKQILEANLEKCISKDDKESAARSAKSLRQITRYYETVEEILGLEAALSSRLEQSDLIESIENDLRKVVTEELHSFMWGRINKEYAIYKAACEAYERYQDVLRQHKKGDYAGDVPEEPKVVTEELHSFMQDRINKEYAIYKAACEAYERYQDLLRQREKGDYAGDVPEEPTKPVCADICDVASEYGNLNDLSNLIKVSEIEVNVLSEILYQRFEEDGMMEDIIAYLEQEYTTLNLVPELVRLILEGCDVQFDKATPTEKGFLKPYLKEAIKQRFEEISTAYRTDRNELGQTPLHIAIQQNEISKVIELLSENKTSINESDNFNNTPLHLAVRLNNLEIIKLLLQAGADTRVKNKLSETPLHVSAMFGNIEMIDLLLDKDEAGIQDKTDNGHSLLHTAARQNNSEIIKHLIAKGLAVDIKDDKGWTPLHMAANNGHINVARILIDHRADINAMDNAKQTPLNIATNSLRNTLAVCELLIEKGAK